METAVEPDKADEMQPMDVGTMSMRKLLPLAQCRLNGGTFVEFDGRELAVFRLTEPERLVVVDNACPHASGNLSGGEVHGGVVTCPWHQWEFDLDRGVCAHSAKARVVKYPVEVKDGYVCINLPPKAEREHDE